MKKVFHKTAAVLAAALIALASTGCAKSPKALAQETVKLEQQVLDAGADAQKTAKAAQDFVKHFEALDKLSDANRKQYEEILAALIIADPTKTVPVNPLRGTRWIGADQEDIVLEFDRGTFTYKLNNSGKNIEGKYELVTAVNIELGGSTEAGRISGNTLEFSDIEFSKKSGTDVIKNTQWEGETWGNPITINFTIDTFTMSAGGESMEGKFGVFYVIGLSLPDGDTEVFMVDGTTLKDRWDDVIFNKITGTASTQTQAAPAAAPPAQAAASTPAAAPAPTQTSVGTAPGGILEVEPNDTELTAQVIRPGVTVNGSFAADDDEDYYKITLASSGKLTAYTEGADDVFMLWIEELDEDGRYNGLLAEGTYISGYEGDVRVEADLAAGTYCLYLKGYDASPYSLKTSFAPGTVVPASSGTNWDSLLDQYEKFVDDYIVAMQKAVAGDFSAMTTAASLMEQAETLSGRLTAASGEISAAQSARLLRIQTKLANAAASLL